MREREFINQWKSGERRMGADSPLKERQFLATRIARTVRSFWERSKEGRLDPNKLVSYESYQTTINQIVFSSRFCRDKIVLDVGCGYGYASQYFRKAGAEFVVGGDIDCSVVKSAHKRYRAEDRLAFMRLSATHLPFPDKAIGCIVCVNLIEHLKNYRKFLRECRRVLRGKGTLVCSTRNGEMTPIMSPHHTYEFSIKEFYAALSEYFDLLVPYGQLFLDPKDVEKKKITNLIEPIMSILLTFVPFGNTIREKLAICIRRHERRFREDFESAIDEGYTITALKDDLRIPQALIAKATQPLGGK